MVKLSLSPLIAASLFYGAAMTPEALSAYCNWGPEGTGASSTCELQSDGSHVQGGDYCNVGQTNCESGCGGRWCLNDDGTDGPPGPTPPTPPTNGPPSSVLTATTTRYWDCSGGACACSYIPTGLTTNEPSHCHSNAMFAAPSGNPYGATYYGAAAISATLGGGNWMAEGCGKCWKVTGTSNALGYEGDTSTLVLKGTNFCPDGNPMCRAGAHFDIAAPGFDVLAYSFAHECPTREPEEAEGFAACGTWLIDDNDPDTNCDCSLFKSPTLRAGCENFYSLKWDNPTVTYEELTSCPPELADLHCEYPYATEGNMPDTCASNDFGEVTSTTSSSTSATTTVTTTTPPATTQPPPSTTTTSATTQPPPTTTETSTTVTTTTTSTTPATTSKPSGDNCCSWNYASCGDDAWCNESEANCDDCGGKAWMEPNPNCIPLYGECTGDRQGCCNPLGNLRCNGGRWYRQCQE
mmetsp:Transcript_28535/g.61323  ORF Transcript_28535/g.61323 Transcript_28535/m.61323 type:complete len:465 (-) Transcript_28535:226-1620(-)